MYNKSAATLNIDTVRAFLNDVLPDLVADKDTAQTELSCPCFGRLFRSLFKSARQLCVRISMQNTHPFRDPYSAA